MIVTCPICKEYFFNYSDFQKFKCSHENHATCGVAELFGPSGNAIETDFAVVGMKDSGKSYFIYTLLHLLLDEDQRPQGLNDYMEYIGMRVELADRQSKEQFAKFETLILAGKLQTGTLPQAPENNIPLNLIIKVGTGMSEQKVRLTFFDISGERYDPNGNFRDFMRTEARIHRTQGIIYLLSPFEDLKLYRMLKENDMDRAISALTYPIYEALYDAIQANTSDMRKRSKVNVPIAFCVSQFDLLQNHVPEKLRQPYIEITDMMNDRQEFRFEKVDYFNQEIQQFLKTNSNIRPNNLHNLYSEVNFFAMTSIGHDKPSAIPIIGLKPQGILAPLFWLLARHHIIPVVGENYS